MVKCVDNESNMAGKWINILIGLSQSCWDSYIENVVMRVECRLS
jgi:hypothetical protein